MSSDAETHRELLSALRAAQGKGDGTFERAVTRAFEHVFEHLNRARSPVAADGTPSEDRPLQAGESPTLR